MGAACGAVGGPCAVQVPHRNTVRRSELLRLSINRTASPDVAFLYPRLRPLSFPHSLSQSHQLSVRIWRVSLFKLRLAVDLYGRAGEAGIAAAQHLTAIFPSADSANRTLWRESLPLSLRVLHASKECSTEERQNLSFRVGRWLYEDRRFQEAIRCFEEVQQRKPHKTDQYARIHTRLC